MSEGHWLMVISLRHKNLGTTNQAIKMASGVHEVVPSYKEID